MSRGAEMEIRLLLRIVLLFLFAFCTLSARLQRKSSPYHYDYMTIGQPSQSSDISHSSDYIRTGEPSSPFVSLFQTTKPSSCSSCSCSGSSCSCCCSGSSCSCSCSGSSCSCSGSGSGYSPVRQPVLASTSIVPEAANISPSTSTVPKAANISPSTSTVPKAANISPSTSTVPKAANISVSAGASRGRVNMLGQIGITIAATLVLLLICVAVLKAFKKATHNDNGNNSDKLTDTAGQLDSPSGNNLEEGIGTDTAGQLDSPSGNNLEEGIGTDTAGQLDSPSGNNLEEGIGIYQYTMKELISATDNFSTEVGKGGSASVYRANLPGNRLGAVKRAKKAEDIDLNLFKQELSVLLRLPRHRRLVDLIGLCLEAGERILVFEFISGGSLYDRLHKNKGPTSPLPWAARMDIAFQVAVALKHLHEKGKPPILHRDVKSANVLLADDNCAKLADFGLSKLGPKDNQFTFTNVRGTSGYIDPQYTSTNRYSAKSDVYSFGVILLELITGLKALHENTPLAEWTQTYRLSEGIDGFMTIVDRNMIDQVNRMELQSMIKVANLCLRDITEERPLMREIVNMMKETRNINANGSVSDSDEALI